MLVLGTVLKFKVQYSADLQYGDNIGIVHSNLASIKILQEHLNKVGRTPSTQDQEQSYLEHCLARWSFFQDDFLLARLCPITTNN